MTEKQTRKNKHVVTCSKIGRMSVRSKRLHVTNLYLHLLDYIIAVYGIIISDIRIPLLCSDKGPKWS